MDHHLTKCDELGISREEVVEAVGANGLAGSRMIVLNALLRLRQVCCDLRLLKLENVEAASASAKMDLFAELARDMNFHNPRQLIRLRNSYRLLKGYRHRREKRAVDTRWVEFLMHGLFWYEFLYQQKLSDRQLAELVAWEWSSKDWEQLAAQKDAEAEEKRKQLEAAGDKRAEQLANPPVVNMSRRLNELLPKDKWADGYPGLMQTVEMVVLPNAQMGLLLKRHDVDDLLYGQSTSVSSDRSSAPSRSDVKRGSSGRRAPRYAPWP